MIDEVLQSIHQEEARVAEAVQAAKAQASAMVGEAHERADALLLHPRQEDEAYRARILEDAHVRVETAKTEAQRQAQFVAEQLKEASSGRTAPIVEDLVRRIVDGNC